MEKKDTLELIKLIKAQEEGGGNDPNLKEQFEQEMDKLSAFRFGVCLAIFFFTLPFLEILDLVFHGSYTHALSRQIREVMALVLVIYCGLYFIPQFKRNVYVFTFLLTLFMGIYNLVIILVEKETSMDRYILYALIFSIVGVVMPWGPAAIAGVCLPVYLFYPIGMLVGNVDVSPIFLLKSNAYLILFMLIVIFGSAINHRFRYQEFLLKKRMERANSMLEDYQARLKRSYSRMENLAIIDPLTGAYNRTYLTHWLSTEIHKNKSAWDVFTMIMYDVDKFKEINDVAGHQMGDRVLQRLTEIVLNDMERGGQVFRYGGDEFCLIFPGLNLAKGIKTAERIRLNVELHPDLLVKLSPTESFHITISVGVISEYATGTVDPDYLIRWADAALLESKRQGRNCVHVFDSEKRKILSAVEWFKTNSSS